MPILSPNVLLTFMLAAYSIPIAFVYFKYASAPLSRSISSIITSTEPFCLFAAASFAPPPPCIPNETLYCSMYAHNGGVHRALRNPS